jgi:hypothetical protein
MLRVRQPASTDGALFPEYISRDFLPYFQGVRSKWQFARKTLLLMDAVSPHGAADVPALLGHRTVAIIIFPAHTTNITQALDRSLFPAFNIRKRTAKGDSGDHVMKDYITEVLRAYEKVCQLQYQGMFSQGRLCSRQQNDTVSTRV